MPSSESSAGAGAPPVPLRDWLTQLAALELRSIEVDVAFPAGVRVQDPVCCVVRGLLGERLRDVARAVYDAHFETESEEGTPPYWLAGLPADRVIPAGGSRTVRLAAVGPAVASLAYFDVALHDALGRLGRPGGTEDRPRLGLSRLARVDWPAASPAAGTALRIQASTPLLLRGDCEACARMCPAAPDLALLARAGVRRLDALLAAFGPGTAIPRVAFPDLGRLEVADGGFAPWRASRFSRRQGRHFPLQGLVGWIEVRGATAAELAPLMAVLAVTGVGKLTTMGFGTLAVDLA